MKQSTFLARITTHCLHHFIFCTGSEEATKGKPNPTSPVEETTPTATPTPRTDVTPVPDFNNCEKKKCNYKIDDNHIFFPVVYPDRLAGFHSTILADQSAEIVYKWKTPPPASANDDPFSATYKVPSKPKLEKTSSFFPMDLSEFSVLEIIGDAYVKGGCRAYGNWTGEGVDSYTQVRLPVDGYVTNHVITTAYPGGLPNHGD